MGDSLTKLYVHAVYSTKNREDILRRDTLDAIWEYTAAVLRNIHCTPLAIGGTTNHVHALFVLDKTRALSDVMRTLKAATSKWYTERTRNYFEWQTGYGAFTVSQSRVEAVQRYIANQATHHAKHTFEDEMRDFYDQYDIPYNERYAWG